MEFTRFTEYLEEIQEALVEPLVITDEWLSWTAEQQNEMRAVVDFGQALFERVLRPKFDNAVYNGKTRTGVASIRAKGEYESRPGRKADKPTPAEIVARAMQR